MIKDNFTDYSGYFIGDVLELDKINRKACIYIPKLMPLIEGGEIRRNEQFVETSNENNVSINNTIMNSNGVWGQPKNISNCLPAIGSKVLCFFLEDYYLIFEPFDVNGDYADDQEDVDNNFIRQSLESR